MSTLPPVVDGSFIYCPYCGKQDTLHASYCVNHGGQLFVENGKPVCYFFEDDTASGHYCWCEACEREVMFDGDEQ